MEISISEKQHSGKTLYTMNCGMDCHLLRGCGGCNCFRFTYKGGVVTTYEQGHGCAQTGQPLYAATTEAECLARMGVLGLAPITPQRLSCEIIVNSGAGKSFQLPTEADGTYDSLIWTKKVTDKTYSGEPLNITQWDQAETDLSFADDDFYNIKIEKIFEGFRFNNGGDKLKLLEFLSFGSLKTGNNGGNFYGCNNLTLDRVRDILNISGNTTLYRFFRDNTSLQTIRNLRYWDASNITNFYQTWRGDSLFNGEVEYLDVSSGQDFTNTFSLNTAFSRNIGLWNTPAMTTCLGILNACGNFDHSFSNWNIENLTTGQLALQGVTLSTSNYNPILESFAAQAVQYDVRDVNFHFGLSKYSAGDPEDARNVLLGKNWNIIDAGKE